VSTGFKEVLMSHEVWTMDMALFFSLTQFSASHAYGTQHWVTGNSKKIRHPPQLPWFWDNWQRSAGFRLAVRHHYWPYGNWPGNQPAGFANRHLLGLYQCTPLDILWQEQSACPSVKINAHELIDLFTGGTLDQGSSDFKKLRVKVMDNSRSYKYTVLKAFVVSARWFFYIM
jgi:hypothetical protein